MKMKKLFFISVVFNCILTAALIVCSSTKAGSNTAEIKEFNLDYKQAFLHERAIRTPLQDMLHMTWVRFPGWVEDGLMDTEEYQQFYEAVGGNTEDTFLFWDESDSVHYYQNWVNPWE